MPGTPLMDAFIRLRVDDSDVPRQASASGKKAGTEFGGQFDREAAAGVKKTGAGLANTLKPAATEAGKASGKALVQGFENLPRTMKGVISQTSAQFRALPDEMKVAAHKANTEALHELAAGMKPAGKEAGSDFGQAFFRDAGTGVSRLGTRLRTAVGGDARRAGAAAGDDFGKAFADEAVDTADSQDIAGGIAGKIGAAGAGLAIGGSLIAGFSEAMQREQLGDKLTAQVGAAPRQAKRYGTAAGNLFAGAWGDSVEDVNTAVASVVTNIAGMRHATRADLEATTATVLDLATAFDEDSNSISRAADQLVRTDLAKGPREALDIITRGFQSGANEAEDLLDTYAEYGTQFRKLGFDGKEATGLLSQGLKAGARDADVVADAFKEFSIRAVDGSDLTQQSFDALGLSAEDMQDKIGRGGKSAADATGLVLDKLRRVKDPADRAQIAVGLFGTQSEDLGKALFALDPKHAVDTLGKVGGAARRMGKGLNDNATTRFTEFKRSVQTDFVNFVGNTLLPAADDLGKAVGPDLRRLGHAVFNMGEDMGPVAKDVLPIFADTLSDVAGVIGDLGTAFSKLPKPLQTALITGALFAYGGKKLGLLGRGGSVAAGGLLGGAAAGGGAAAAGGGVAAGAGAASVGAEVAGTATAFTRLTNSPLLRKAGWLGLAVGTYDAAKQVKGLQVNTNGLGRNVNRIRDELEDSAIGDYAADIGINIDRLARSLAAQGSKGEYAQRVMHKLQVRGENLGESFFRKVVNPFKMQNDKLDQARHAYENLTPAIDETIRRQRRDADATRDSTRASDNLWDLFRSNLIPTARDLADKYDLTRGQSRRLATAFRDATSDGKGHEKQLRQVADRLGLDERQTRQLIKAYRDVPKKVDTDVELHTQEAERRRNDFLKKTKGAFADLGNNTYAIMVNGTSGHGRLFEADGGIVHYASGGLESHVAQIAKPGTMRMWAEPETGGEAYIPLAQSKRSRSLDIWQQTGRHLGVEGFADGGITGQVNTKVNLDLSQLRQTVKQVLEAIRNSAAGGGGMTPQQVARGLAFARSAIGTPYGMGGVGPDVIDCSGAVAATFNAARGKNPHQRLGSTSSMPWAHMVPGRGGVFQVGWSPPGGIPGSSFGHTAATLNGINIESSGGVGFHIGSSARGADDPIFKHHAYFTTAAGRRFPVTGGPGDAAFVGRGGALSASERWLLRHEGGSVTSNNPTTSAFGIGQLISANRVKYAKRLGLNWHKELGDTGTTDYASQLAMMRMYTHDRYGNARNAVDFWKSHGWYGDGLSGGVFTKPTMIGVGERGPERVDVTPLHDGQRLARALQPGSRSRPLHLSGHLDITNWKTGEAHFRGIARDEADQLLDFDATTGRMD